MGSLYDRDFDWRRRGADDQDPSWRSPYMRDYGRVIHSASFRRLQGKTQVFPGHESDFFRNRLTHSLEVAQIAEGIAEFLNDQHSELKGRPERQIDTRLCATAALVHDLGHPPFGHNGERALDQMMLEHGGFEGNAQSLRIVAHLEKKVVGKDGVPFGLDLTMRSLASILKYDNRIDVDRLKRRGNEEDRELEERSRKIKVSKGYYTEEADLVGEIKKMVMRGADVEAIARRRPVDAKWKTLECWLMDVADDIAYSTFDLEDSLKAGFLTPLGIVSSRDDLIKKVAEEVEKELAKGGIEQRVTPQMVLEILQETFEQMVQGQKASSVEATGLDEKGLRFRMAIGVERASALIATSSRSRTQFSSDLVKEAIEGVELEYDHEYPMLSKVKLKREHRLRVEVLKQYVFQATIFSSRVALREYRGFEVVTTLFKALDGAKGKLLMPDDIRDKCEAAATDTQRKRIVCDYVAGMTDRYAIEFYNRLHSNVAESMWKPV